MSPTLEHRPTLTLTMLTDILRQPTMLTMLRVRSIRPWSQVDSVYIPTNQSHLAFRLTVRDRILLRQESSKGHHLRCPLGTRAFSRSAILGYITRPLGMRVIWPRKLFLLQKSWRYLQLGQYHQNQFHLMVMEAGIHFWPNSATIPTNGVVDNLDLTCVNA